MKVKPDLPRLLQSATGSVFARLGRVRKHIILLGVACEQRGGGGPFVVSSIYGGSDTSHELSFEVSHQQGHQVKSR